MTPHRSTGRGLMYLAILVCLLVLVRLYVIGWSTPVALLGWLAVAGVIEAIAILRHDASTISENTWRVRLLLQDMTRAQRWLVLVLMALSYLGGHLEWQSDRTMAALRCERAGGYMQCIGARQ